MFTKSIHSLDIKDKQFSYLGLTKIIHEGSTVDDFTASW